MNISPRGRFGLSPCSIPCLVCLAATATFALTVAAYGQNSLKPAFQYQLDDVRVSIPTADEPRVKMFGPESVLAAAT